MPLNVFRLYSILPGGSKPGPPPHCNRPRLIAFIVLTDFATESWLMEPLYLPFISCQCAFCPIIYLPVHILFVIIRLAICSLFFLIHLFPRFYFIIFCSLTWLPFCRNKIFPLSVKRIVFISWRSPAIIDDAGFTLGTYPISTVPFSRGTARVNTFSSSLSRVIDQQGELRATREIFRLGERNYDVHSDNPFSPQLLTGNF